MDSKLLEQYKKAARYVTSRNGESTDCELADMAFQLAYALLDTLNRLKIAIAALEQCKCVSTSGGGTSYYIAQEALGRIKIGYRQGCRCKQCKKAKSIRK